MVVHLMTQNILVSYKLNRLLIVNSGVQCRFCSPWVMVTFSSLVQYDVVAIAHTTSRHTTTTTTGTITAVMLVALTATVGMALLVKLVVVVIVALVTIVVMVTVAVVTMVEGCDVIVKAVLKSFVGMVFVLKLVVMVISKLVALLTMVAISVTMVNYGIVLYYTHLAVILMVRVWSQIHSPTMV